MKKKPPPLGVNLVASLTALAALGASIIANVDPVTSLLRGAIGFFVGRALAGIWCALFSSGTVADTGETEAESSHAVEAERADRAAA